MEIQFLQLFNQTWKNIFIILNWESRGVRIHEQLEICQCMVLFASRYSGNIKSTQISLQMVFRKTKVIANNEEEATIRFGHGNDYSYLVQTIKLNKENQKRKSIK